MFNLALLNHITIDPAYILVAGLVSNGLTTAIKREHWTSTQAKAAAVVLSAISGFVAVLAQQKGLHADTLLITMGSTLGVNQTAFGLARNTRFWTWMTGIFNPTEHPLDANLQKAAQVAGTFVDVPATGGAGGAFAAGTGAGGGKSTLG